MNRTMKLFTVSALAALVAIGSGCILEETDVQIVIKDVYCMTFEEDEQSETFVTPRDIDLAEKLDDALAENDVDREDLVMGAMIVATYQVIDAPDHDWTLTGGITVERTDTADGPDTIIHYRSQALSDCTDEPVFAELDQDGVELINRAIDDYIENGLHSSPTLRFKVVNGDCSPNPSPSDRLVFDWEACVFYYAVIEKTLEVVEPFPGSDD